jgi:DNA-binding CsgD family transcriptional regulator
MVGEFGDLAPATEAFASAAVDPTRWNAAMEVVARATGSFGAILLPVRGRSPSMPLSDSMRQAVDCYVHKGWIHRDERYRSLPAFMRKGVACEFDFISREEIAHSPYYQELLAPHGLRWFAGVKVGDGEDIWCLSIQRSIEQGPFQQSDIDRLATFSRQLGGAAELARAFGFARIEMALEAFEASNSGAVVVNRLGETVKVNPSAERLLGRDLQIVRRRVVSWNQGATAALDRALHAVIWAGQGGAFPPVVLPRREGRPILAYPIRVPAIASGALSPGTACVVFVDLAARLTTAVGDLIAAFGLTPCEARLAGKLLSEGSLEAAAESLCVAVGTVRNQLKAVFQKTDTRNQGQLIALIARLATRPHHHTA